MTPLQAAITAKIAYDPAGEAVARRFGYSYQAICRKDHFAWIGERNGVTVVSFRGTAWHAGERQSYRANLSTDLVPWTGPGLVHEGYYQALWQIISAVRRQVRGQENIIVTGHSMGAAIAVLAAILLTAERVFAFACPRVGNRDFATGISGSTRITRYVNRCDFLARLPFGGLVKGSDPPVNDRYVHVGRAVQLPTFGHSMNAYLAGIRSHPSF
jgi:predicted lipase